MWENGQIDFPIMRLFYQICAEERTVSRIEQNKQDDPWVELICVHDSTGRWNRGMGFTDKSLLVYEIGSSRDINFIYDTALCAQ
jgi:hypothetical protein